MPSGLVVATKHEQDKEASERGIPHCTLPTVFVDTPIIREAFSARERWGIQLGIEVDGYLDLIRRTIRSGENGTDQRARGKVRQGLAIRPHCIDIGIAGIAGEDDDF